MPDMLHPGTGCISVEDRRREQWGFAGADAPLNCSEVTGLDFHAPAPVLGKESAELSRTGLATPTG